MKIVHLTTTSAYSEIYAYQENLLAHYHRKMGYDVTIVAPVYSSVELDKKEPAGEQILKNGIKVIRLPLLVNCKIIYEHLYLVRGLKKTIIAENPDLIFAHAIGSLNYRCLTSVKKRMPSVKIVFDNHADYINSLHSPLTRLLHKIIYRYFLVPSLINISEWFYGVTPSRCEFLHEVYNVPKDKIKLLLMGADDEKMMIDNRESIRNRIRLKYNIEENDFLVVTGGKIDSLKNIHILAEAINKSSYSNIKMIIFGTICKELENTFERLISERIKFVGWLANSDVYKFFYAADVVVFPGLHSVLWEQAVASQVPCAFSRMKGFEHLNFGGNCVLLDSKNEDYYRRVIERLYTDQIYYRSLYENSHSESAKCFYYSRIAKQILEDCNLI